MAEKHRMRTKKFSIYLFDEEYEYLKKGAFEYNLSCSDYLRELIVAREIKGIHWTMDREQGQQIINAINRIANDIRLIVYNSHITGASLPDDWNELKTCYFKLLNLLGELPFLEESQREWWAIQATQLLLRHMQAD